MNRRSFRVLLRHAVPLALCAASAIAAQTPPALLAYHPADPTLAYDVTTVKPVGSDRPSYTGTTLRKYISSAYGVPVPWGLPGVEFTGARVLGGPAWIDQDRYEIVGKASDELRVALQKMPSDERTATTRTMQQALLADRFHLKVHFETREMATFDLVPAKGGLKIKSSEPPPAEGSEKPLKPGEMSRNSASVNVTSNGASVLNARAISMEMFLNALRGQSPDVAGRPIVDKTGFRGAFDITDFRFPGQAPPHQDSGGAGEPDTPSLSQALEEKLGLKLIPAKAQVEIVVIDSIDRPTEN